MEIQKRALPNYFTVVSFITGMLVLFGAIALVTNGLHLLVPSANVVGARETSETVQQGLLDNLIDGISVLIVSMPLFWLHFRFLLRQWERQHKETK